MKKLYKFHWDCGRMGHLDGIFVEEESLIEKLIGHKVYFGEVLGKYSEIYGPLEEQDLEILTDDQYFIGKAKEYGLIPLGHNPVPYMLDRIHEDDSDLYEEMTGKEAYRGE